MEDSEDVDVSDPYMRSQPDLSKKRLFAYNWSNGYISPYQPTPDALMKQILDFIFQNILFVQNELLFDLGCGDGRFLLHAAKEYRAQGVGIDLDEVLLKEAEKKAQEEGVASLVQFKNQDLMNVDLSEATIVVVYLLPEALNKVKSKLLPYLQHGKLNKVVSVKWPIEGEEWEQLQDDKWKQEGFYVFSKKRREEE